MLPDTLEDLERSVNEKLRRQPVSSRVLLDRLLLLDEASRKTSQYQDPNYLPFYYYLAKFSVSKTVFQVGLDIGLPICCFLKGCPSVERVLAFQRSEGSFYSPRLATSNIRSVRPSGIHLDLHVGNFLDEKIESMISPGLDAALVTSPYGDDQLNDMLYVIWKYLNLDGMIVVDHMRSEQKSLEVFKSFCKAQNRDCVFFETRYGSAVVRK